MLIRPCRKRVEGFQLGNGVKVEIDKERLAKAEGMLIGSCKKRVEEIQLGKGVKVEIEKERLVKADDIAFMTTSNPVDCMTYRLSTNNLTSTYYPD